MVYIGGKDVDCQYLESTYCIHDVSHSNHIDALSPLVEQEIKIK